jgi:hypothetical protein
MEACVLTEIDTMIKSKFGIGRQNPLAIFVALWNLILLYKEHMVFRKAACQDHGKPDFSLKPEFTLTLTETEKLYDLNQHLYNMLTSIYAALYKTTSPLTLDWRKEEVASMLGNDSYLIGLFGIIKTEIFWSREFSLSSTKCGD